MKRFGWRGALGILISAACLLYVFRAMDWPAAREQLARANYPLMLLATAGGTLMFPLRARRWRTILDPIVPAIPFGPLWRATAIGMMINNVLPARAGEPARAYALTRDVPELTFSAVFASLVIDRVFDAIVVLLLMAVAILAPGSPAASGSLVGKGAVVFAIAAVGLLIALYVLVFFPEMLIRIFELLTRRIAPALEQRATAMLRSFAQGLSILKSPAHFAAVFWWTLLHWMLQPLAFWIGFKAVGIDVSFLAALLVQGVIVIGVSVPSSPGFFGLFETAAALGLGVYGISRTAATTWAVVFHVASFIPITVMGAYYFARAGIKLEDIGSARQQQGAA